MKHENVNISNHRCFSLYVKISNPNQNARWWIIKKKGFQHFIHVIVIAQICYELGIIRTFHSTIQLSTFHPIYLQHKNRRKRGEMILLKFSFINFRSINALNCQLNCAVNIKKDAQKDDFMRNTKGISIQSSYRTQKEQKKAVTWNGSGILI